MRSTPNSAAVGGPTNGLSRLLQILDGPMFSLATREHHSPNRRREALCRFSVGVIGVSAWLLPVSS